MLLDRGALTEMFQCVNVVTAYGCGGPLCRNIDNGPPCRRLIDVDEGMMWYVECWCASAAVQVQLSPPRCSIEGEIGGEKAQGRVRLNRCRNFEGIEKTYIILPYFYLIISKSIQHCSLPT